MKTITFNFIFFAVLLTSPVVWGDASWWVWGDPKCNEIGTDVDIPIEEWWFPDVDDLMTFHIDDECVGKNKATRVAPEAGEVYISVDGNSDSNYAKIHTWDFRTHDYEQWYRLRSHDMHLVYEGDNYEVVDIYVPTYQIVNKGSGKCISARGLDPGNDLVQYNCDENTSRRWFFNTYVDNVDCDSNLDCRGYVWYQMYSVAAWNYNKDLLCAQIEGNPAHPGNGDDLELGRCYNYNDTEIWE